MVVYVDIFSGLLFCEINLIIGIYGFFWWSIFLNLDRTLRFGNIFFPVLNFSLVNPSFNIIFINLKQLVQELKIELGVDIGGDIRIDFLNGNDTVRVKIEHDGTNFKYLTSRSNLTCHINSLKKIKAKCVKFIQACDFSAFAIP